MQMTAEITLDRARESITSLAIPGGWSEREVRVGAHTFRLLTPADPDSFLNHLVEPIDTTTPHLADPYWAKVWPAAGFLAEAILKTEVGAEGSGFRVQGSGVRGQRSGASQATNPESKIQNPKSCLELGCGSGLVGLAALAAGYDVTFGDYVPQAVELALENAARNGLPQARGLVFDWRQPPSIQFPWIVAADVIYDRTNLGPLLDTVERMLAPDGQAWFGDAGRGPAAEFLQLARDRGWSVSLWDEHGRPAVAPVLGHCQRFVLKRPVKEKDDK
jgi:SAM-dependent methyltransferase